MAKTKTHEVFDTLFRVQHAPNEKILDNITIINFQGVLPQKIKLGTYEIAKLKEILDGYEFRQPFVWEREK